MKRRDLHPSDELDSKEVRRGSHPGDRYVRVAHDPRLRREAPGRLTVTPRGEEPAGGFGKLYYRFKKAVIGAPIETEREAHERLTRPKALAVLSSDALSSVAYAPEEMLLALLIAGTAALAYSFPIALAIVVLLVIVTFSYSQTIKAYPKGGGSYVVASDNLGTLPGLTAGASLMIGYILTVAVSIAAGVSALIAAFPGLGDHRITLGVLFIALITLANLRGIREAGTIFAVPTFVFILSMLALIGVGFYQLVTGTARVAPPSTVEHAASGLSLFLLLRAFASGSAAMTGVEAISDGVPAFQPPEWRNARTTLVWMAAILGTTFSGLTYLAYRLNIVPDEAGSETVVSQMARLIFGGGPVFYILQASTVLILILAANTSFSDFPRLAYFMARDRFLPRQFEIRGDRLAYSNGIVALGIISAGLLAAFGGDTHALIPLYAVGVFLAFTLSQSGMVARWWRSRQPGWQRSLVINGIGAFTTGLVTIIVSVVRFGEGAWIVVLVIPILVLLFLGINRHYTTSTRELSPETPLAPEDILHTIIVPIAKLNRVALQSLAYARSISPNVTAVHVTDDEAEGVALQEEWTKKYAHLGDLVVINSPYRSVVGPIMAYIDALDQKYHDDTITVILPEFVAKHWWENVLHNQTALRLKAALLFRRGTVTVNVPYHLSG
jgi:amino acid transporter